MKLKLQLLGEIFLGSDGNILTEEEISSKKMVQLLVFILLNRTAPITQQRLIDIFCDESNKGPGDTIKNLIYRLRNILKKMGNESFILTQSGAYEWNPEITVETDYEKFEALYAQIQNRMEDDEKVAVCKAALECFSGEFSSRIIHESWFEERANRLEEQRKEILKTLCSIEEAGENWERLLEIANQALAIDPVDEDFHVWLIRSYSGMEKYEYAIRHYESAKQTIYEGSGVSRTEKLQSVYLETVAAIGRYIRNIGTILVEAAEAEKPKGAYLCDYQTFRQIYQVEVRKSDRLNAEAQVMLISLVSTELSRPMEEINTTDIMQILARTIQSSLRAGDVIAPCSSLQFVILLSGCSYENGIIIADRIRKNFKRNIGRKPFRLLYDLEELQNYDLKKLETS